MERPRDTLILKIILRGISIGPQSISMNGFQESANLMKKNPLNLSSTIHEQEIKFSMKFTFLPIKKINPITSKMEKTSTNNTGWRLVSYFGDDILHRKKLSKFKSYSLKRF